MTIYRPEGDQNPKYTSRLVLSKPAREGLGMVPKPGFDLEDFI